MKNSAIEWTHHTFNPWIGCTQVSPACDHCYAMTMMDHRYHRVEWGVGKARVRTSADYWRQPLRWHRAAQAAKVRERVFCASLADVFDGEAPEVLNVWRAELWQLIARTPQLDWLLLTKRPGNVLRMSPWGSSWPANVCTGRRISSKDTVVCLFTGSGFRDAASVERMICGAICKTIHWQQLDEFFTTHTP